MEICTLSRFILRIYRAFLIALLFSSGIQAQVLHLESFDGTTFPPTGWQQGGTNTTYLTRVTTGIDPTEAPHTGAGEVEFNSYSLFSGTTLLISPAVDWSHLGTDSAQISFWFYRDGVSYNTTTYDSEGVKLLINTSATDVGATQLTFVPRRIGATPIVAATGWYKYSYYVPRTFNTATNYFILKFNSQDGDNCFLDDVSWQSFPTPCSGLPVAGTVLSSSNPTCPSASFTLSLQNSSIAGGLRYQWQSSPDSVTWTNIPGDTANVLTTTTATNIFYRCQVTCTASGSMATTPGYHESVNPFYNCYCIPAASNCNAGDVITNVTFAGINNSSSCSTNGYTQYDSTSNVLKTLSYPISVHVNNGGTENVSVWIDFDHSGTFDASEYVAVGSGTGGVTFISSIAIPSTALTGITRMRVRDQYGSQLPNTGACATLVDGETEDYLVNIQPAPVCTNPPTAGNIGANQSICSGDSLQLNLTGQTLGTAVQWQSSTDSLNWSNITGAVNSYYSTGPIADSIYYRVKVTCTDSVYTRVIKVSMKPGYLCYCSEPTIGGATACNTADQINNVAIANTTLFTFLVCNVTNGYAYTQFPDSAHSTGSMYASGTYTITVACTDASANMAAWVDYNHNGIFEASENIFLDPSTTGGNESFQFVVPSNALLGATGLRIRSTSTALTTTSACTQLFNGETEDYTVHILAPPPCTNPPAAGTISGDTSICSGNTINLVLGGETLGTSLQWQTSSDHTNWSDVPGATASAFTTPILTDTLYYFRVKVKCADSVYTSAFKIRVTPAYLCYCNEPAIGGAADCISGYSISSVSITGTPLNTANVCNVTNGYAYTSFVDTGSNTAILYPTLTYSLNVACSNASGAMTGWIDYNHNGVFEANESIFLSANTTGAIETFLFTIPANAVTGLTGMRIRSNSFSIGTSDGCTNEFSGETEDYLVTIAPLPPCTNPPATGVISGDTNTCSGNTVTLFLNGQTLGTALQWQTSINNVTWTDVAGANTTAYITPAITDSVYYRVKVKCADSTYTPVFKVGLSPFNLCYCNPGTSTCTFGDVITNVTFAGINNTTTCSPNGYAQYLTPVAQVQRLVSYPVSVTVGNGSTEYVAVWIDYDHSGTFDASEYNLVGSGTGTTLTTGIAIPNSALLGATAMRVRVEAFGTPLAADACTTIFDGETEDYQVNIGVAPPCVTTPVPGTVTGPDSATAGLAQMYVTTGSAGTLQWIYSTTSATGPYTTIGGATNDTLNFILFSSGSYWIAVVAGGPGCLPDTSVAVHTLSILHGDNVCDALPLHFGANGPFSTVNASVQVGEPSAPALGCQVQNGWCSSTLQNTLWFTFVAPPSGRISVNTVGFDTKLAVWKAATCDTILHGGAILLGANDDDPNYSLHGNHQFSSYIDSISCLTPGKIYYVQLVAYSAPGDTTTIALRDLGPGPDPHFILAPRFCLPSAPVALVDASGGGMFSGRGVTNNIFYPDSAGVGGPYIIKDSLYGCYKAYDTVTITPGPQITTNKLVNINCHGDSTGAIKVTASNGTPAYHYSWSNGAVNDSIVHLRAGVYILTVTDSAGCISHPDTIQVTQPVLLTATLNSLNNVNCSGGLTGSASVVATGGVLPYHYSWSNGATTSAINGVSAGTYTLHLTDSLNCYAVPVTVQLTGPDTFVIVTDTLTNISTCYGGANGAIYVSAMGGNGPPYSFVWSTGATTSSITGLTGGNYIITGTDGSGCLSSPDTIQVTQPDSIYASLDSIVKTGCTGPGTGAVYIHATGGTGPFTYSWNNSATTQNITNLTAQSYSVTITDSHSCHGTSSFTVTTRPGFIVTTNITDQQQGGTLGSISQTANGGTAPYTYAWSNSATTQNLTGLQAGIYVSTITDAVGCSVITSDTVKLTTGIEVINGSLMINIFPNPTQSNVYIDIDLDKAKNVTLQIYDLTGRLIISDEQRTTLKARFDVDLKVEASGIYLAKIKVGETLITRRIVLTK